MTKEDMNKVADLVSAIVVFHQKLGMPKQFFMDALSGAWDVGVGALTIDEAREEMKERYPAIMAKKNH